MNQNQNLYLLSLLVHAPSSAITIKAAGRAHLEDVRGTRIRTFIVVGPTTTIPLIETETPKRYRRRDKAASVNRKHDAPRGKHKRLPEILPKRIAVVFVHDRRR